MISYPELQFLHKDGQYYDETNSVSHLRNM